MEFMGLFFLVFLQECPKRISRIKVFSKFCGRIPDIIGFVSQNRDGHPLPAIESISIQRFIEQE